MSEPQATNVRKKRRRWGFLRRLMLAVSGSFLALLAIVFVPWAYRHINDARDLRQYLAELDSSDPGWRLDDVLEARREVPDEENSALVIADALGRLPEDRVPDLDGLLDPPLPPQMQLDEGRVADLDEELAGIDPVIEAAARMRSMTHGRHRLSLTADPDEMDLRSRRAAGFLSELARLHAARAAQRGDMRSALLDCEIALRALRSIGDDPLHRTQWWRMMRMGRVLLMLERVLAQGEPPAAELVSLQALLREEEKEPLAMYVWRGLRARLDAMYAAIARGDLRVADLLKRLGPNTPLHDSWLEQYANTTLAREHRLMVDWCGRALAIAARPAHEQIPLEKALRADQEEYRIRMRLDHLFGSCLDFGRDHRMHLAAVRCTQVALALERYRAERRAWPADLRSLSPAYLGAVPLDPFDGEPLRYKKLADGVVVYSVGPDGADDGGKIDRERPKLPGTDLGYRLWDVKHRRQPYRPEAEKPE